MTSKVTNKSEYMYTNEELRELDYLRNCSLEHFMDEMNHRLLEIIYAWKKDSNNTDTLLLNDAKLKERLLSFIKNNVSSKLELYDINMENDDDMYNDTDNNYDEYY